MDFMDEIQQISCMKSGRFHAGIRWISCMKSVVLISMDFMHEIRQISCQILKNANLNM